MTVKELIVKLEKMPEDAEIVTYKSDMESHGIRKAYFNPRLVSFSKQEREAWDSFDGTDYIYTVFVEDKDGDTQAVYM